RLSRSISKSCSFMGAPLHSSWKCWEDYKQTADCHVLLDRFTKLCFPFCREFCGWLRRAERGFEAMSNLGWIVLGLIALAAIYAVSVYNGLVTLRQRCRQAFSDIDVQLKQRHDLIPNLVETVKGYASHERETLDAVIRARNQAI